MRRSSRWCWLSFTLMFVACPQVLAAEQRPNFVFLLADDLRWDALACTGHPFVRTPHLDALAAQGVRFRNAFVTTPICAASRASIFTGLHERTHRFTFGTPPIRTEHVRISYPYLLKQAGYRTGLIGKFGVQVEKQGQREMFDVFTPLNRTPYLKKQPDGTLRHLTDIEGDHAIEFIRSCDPKQPFCLSLSFNAPHAEDADPKQYYWSAESDGLYEDAKYPPPATMSDAFFATLPAFLRESESRVRFRWRFDEPEKYQRMVRGYFRMITDIDRVVGRIRGALREKGFEQNTILIFTSDNGYFLGERGFADKWYIYEPSIRVPLLLYDPRQPAERRGQTCDRMVLNLDLAPTLLEFAGVAVPKQEQGRSLLPLLHGQTPADWRTDFLFEHLFHHKNIPKSEGVRTERYSYVRWFESNPLVEELYDHQADPQQVKNRIADPRWADLAQRLRKRTDELIQRYSSGH